MSVVCVFSDNANSTNRNIEFGAQLSTEIIKQLSSGQLSFTSCGFGELDTS